MRTTKNYLQYLVQEISAWAGKTYKLDKNGLGYSLHCIGPNGSMVQDVLATNCRLTATEMKYYLTGILSMIDWTLKNN